MPRGVESILTDRPTDATRRTPSNICSGSATTAWSSGTALSEWCGHGPILEEDIALANIALDLIGQATMFLRLAGEVEGKAATRTRWRTAATSASSGTSRYSSCPAAISASRSSGSFSSARILTSCWSGFPRSSNSDLAAIAAKAAKETRYHVRHSAEWVARLGDGTEESHGAGPGARSTSCGPGPGSSSRPTTSIATLSAAGIGADLDAVRVQWDAMVREQLARATLNVPEAPMRMTGGRKGRHTEHLGHMLAEMQIVARSHPGAKW